MLDQVIRFSLRHRTLVLVAAVLLTAYGLWRLPDLPIDVFPDLNRPRVVVITEAHGLAPEEVESLVTLPIERALNGATGVMAVRSTSAVGISVIYVEFDWDTNIYDDRQVVSERLQLVADSMPVGVRPQLAPVSSIMGQVLMLGMWSESGDTDPMEVRTTADWLVRQRLLTVPGVAQVFTMGGGREQYQVRIDPEALRSWGVSLAEVRRAIARSNSNATGGYLDRWGAEEILVRGLGRITDLSELADVVISRRGGRSITLADVSRIIAAPQVKRGASSIAYRTPDGRIGGGDAVVLTVSKQPGADTRRVVAEIDRAIADLQASLPDDLRIMSVYSQRSFIDRAIENVVEALGDGGVLVIVVLFMFLLNFRTTLVTLTAIPLSIVSTAIVFALFGLSINTMTLGGLAVAIGELVDDAIVDVENIFRRLRENRRLSTPEPALVTVWKASVEVRSSIVFGTVIVVIVFLPLFALTGMEGRLFAPMGVAYIVSLIASLGVSLTVTPALASVLMIGRSAWRVAALLMAGLMSALTFLWIVPRLACYWPWLAMSPVSPIGMTILATPMFWVLVTATERLIGDTATEQGRLLRGLKVVAGGVIDASTRASWLVLGIAVAGVAWAATAMTRLERDFLPPFNEGAVQVNALLPPGASLSTSDQVGKAVEKRLMEIKEVASLVRRTGRAEQDEHAEGVNVSELVLRIEPEADRENTLEKIRHALSDREDIVTSVEQPIAHLISHMISGVKAQIGIKIFGDDLDQLRRLAAKIERRIEDVPGLTDVVVEQQSAIPQLQIKIDREQLRFYSLHSSDVTDLIQTAMQGEVVTKVLRGQRSIDIVLRLDDTFREDLDQVKRLVVPLPGGGQTPLSSLAEITTAMGPSTIRREQVQRRIVVQANVSGRGGVDVVEEIQSRLTNLELPSGYFLRYSGQFENQRSATRRLVVLAAMSLIGVFILLYTTFGSVNFSLQVMAALPTAFIGAVGALLVTNQTLTIAAMIGFISLCGIASRNGILLLNHYLHLIEHEGQSVTREMVRVAGQERLAPVLMTALTSGIGLLPLALAAGEPGKEILYPLATVIIGGLFTSTAAEFVVRPALFWGVGRGAAEAIVRNRKNDILGLGK